MPPTLSTKAATGDDSEDAASHATTHAFDADAAYRHRRADAAAPTPRLCKAAMPMCQPPSPLPPSGRLQAFNLAFCGSFKHVCGSFKPKVVPRRTTTSGWHTIVHFVVYV